jgi:SAM-dependent methyltransferase
LTLFEYKHDGFCPCCETAQIFTSSNEWFRDHLICPNCGSVVRERALALVLKELLPDWRALSIHESSPVPRGLQARMAQEAPHYIASHYFPHEPFGTIVNGFRNENLEDQTFKDEAFDLVISLDVMEHVFHPHRAYSEIYRTLKKGGYYLHTVPIRKDLVEAQRTLAVLNSDGSINHLTATPEYHGNPIDEKGSLVTHYYGYDISKQIAQWVPFDVRIIRFWDPTHGIIGEYTEVIVCRK